MLKDFKEFIARGNVVDMAVGIILGASFGAIVKSLVEDLLMPPLGLILGRLDFSNFFLVLRDGKTPPPYHTVAEAKAAGAVTLNYGLCVTSVVSFLLVAFAVFLLVRAVNRMRRKAEAAPTTKDCPRCLSKIPIPATKCAHCTAELQAL